MDKNPQTGYIVKRHLRTKNPHQKLWILCPQMTLHDGVHDVPKLEFFMKFRKSNVAIYCGFFVHKRRSTIYPGFSKNHSPSGEPLFNLDEFIHTWTISGKSVTLHNLCNIWYVAGWPFQPFELQLGISKWYALECSYWKHWL